MKTSEFKKRVEDMGYDLSYDRFNDNIYIHTQNITERIGYIYLTKQYYFGFNDLSLVTDEIFDLLADYAKTPIEEREDKLMKNDLLSGSEVSDEMECEHCGESLKIGDDYIKYDGERFCDDCYESYSIESFFIGGEFLATDNEGVERYCWWDKEEVME